MRSEDRATVLVTGATGFIGLNCVEHLLRRGLRVVAIAADDLPHEAAAELDRLAGELRFVRVDVRDGQRLRRSIEDEGVEILIHGAAITAGGERDRSEADRIVDVNIRGTQTVLDAARAGPVRRIVYVSSGAVYGAATFGPDPVDELTPPEPITLYAISKLTGEQLMRRHGELHDAEIVAARLSAVFGPWERDTGVRDLLSPLYQLSLAARRGASVSLPPADMARGWLYSRDAAEALARLALGPRLRHFLYNVTPSTTFPIGAWAERLGAAYQDFTVTDADEGTPLSFDSDPGLRRAPVDNDRLRQELAGWPHFAPDRAFDDYLEWLAVHPDWM